MACRAAPADTAHETVERSHCRCCSRRQDSLGRAPHLVGGWGSGAGREARPLQTVRHVFKVVRLLQHSVDAQICPQMLPPNTDVYLL